MEDPEQSNMSSLDLYADMIGETEERREGKSGQMEEHSVMSSMDLYENMIGEAEGRREGKSGQLEEHSVMSSMDLYEDIIEEERENEKFEELRSQFTRTAGQVQDLTAQMADIQTEKQSLAAENQALKKNISALFVTAKAELERKQKEIARLRADLEQMQMRRRARSMSVEPRTLPRMPHSARPSDSRCDQSRAGPSHSDTQDTRSSYRNVRDRETLDCAQTHPDRPPRRLSPDRSRRERTGVSKQLSEESRGQTENFRSSQSPEKATDRRDLARNKTHRSKHTKSELDIREEKRQTVDKTDRVHSVDRSVKTRRKPRQAKQDKNSEQNAKEDEIQDTCGKTERCSQERSRSPEERPELRSQHGPHTPTYPYPDSEQEASVSTTSSKEVVSAGPKTPPEPYPFEDAADSLRSTTRKSPCGCASPECLKKQGGRDLRNDEEKHHRQEGERRRDGENRCSGEKRKDSAYGSSGSDCLSRHSRENSLEDRRVDCEGDRRKEQACPDELKSRQRKGFRDVSRGKCRDDCRDSRDGSLEDEKMDCNEDRRKDFSRSDLRSRKLSGEKYHCDRKDSHGKSLEDTLCTRVGYVEDRRKEDLSSGDLRLRLKKRSGDISQETYQEGYRNSRKKSLEDEKLDYKDERRRDDLRSRLRKGSRDTSWEKDQNDFKKAGRDKGSVEQRERYSRKAKESRHGKELRSREEERGRRNKKSEDRLRERSSQRGRSEGRQQAEVGRSSSRRDKGERRHLKDAREAHKRKRSSSGEPELRRLEGRRTASPPRKKQFEKDVDLRRQHSREKKQTSSRHRDRSEGRNRERSRCRSDERSECLHDNHHHGDMMVHDRRGHRSKFVSYRDRSEDRCSEPYSYRSPSVETNSTSGRSSACSIAGLKDVYKYLKTGLDDSPPNSERLPKGEKCATSCYGETFLDTDVNTLEHFATQQPVLADDKLDATSCYGETFMKMGVDNLETSTEQQTVLRNDERDEKSSGGKTEEVTSTTAEESSEREKVETLGEEVVTDSAEELGLYTAPVKRKREDARQGRVSSPAAKKRKSSQNSPTKKGKCSPRKNLKGSPSKTFICSPKKSPKKVLKKVGESCEVTPKDLMMPEKTPKKSIKSPQGSLKKKVSSPCKSPKKGFKSPQKTSKSVEELLETSPKALLPPERTAKKSLQASPKKAVSSPSKSPKKTFKSPQKTPKKSPKTPRKTETLVEKCRSIVWTGKSARGKTVNLFHIQYETADDAARDVFRNSPLLSPVKPPTPSLNLSLRSSNVTSGDDSCSLPVATEMPVATATPVAVETPVAMATPIGIATHVASGDDSCSLPVAMETPVATVLPVAMATHVASGDDSCSLPLPAISAQLRNDKGEMERPVPCYHSNIISGFRGSLNALVESLDGTKSNTFERSELNMSGSPKGDASSQLPFAVSQDASRYSGSSLEEQNSLETQIPFSTGAEASKLQDPASPHLSTAEEKQPTNSSESTGPFEVSINADSAKSAKPDNRDNPQAQNVCPVPQKEQDRKVGNHVSRLDNSIAEDAGKGPVAMGTPVAMETPSSPSHEQSEREEITPKSDSELRRSSRSSLSNFRNVQNDTEDHTSDGIKTNIASSSSNIKNTQNDTVEHHKLDEREESTQNADKIRRNIESSLQNISSEFDSSTANLSNEELFAVEVLAQLAAAAKTPTNSPVKAAVSTQQTSPQKCGSRKGGEKESPVNVAVTGSRPYRMLTPTNSPAKPAVFTQQTSPQKCVSRKGGKRESPVKVAVTGLTPYRLFSPGRAEPTIASEVEVGAGWSSKKGSKRRKFGADSPFVPPQKLTVNKKIEDIRDVSMKEKMSKNKNKEKDSKKADEKRVGHEKSGKKNSKKSVEGSTSHEVVRKDSKAKKTKTEELKLSEVKPLRTSPRNLQGKMADDVKQQSNTQRKSPRKASTVTPVKSKQAANETKCSPFKKTAAATKDISKLKTKGSKEVEILKEKPEGNLQEKQTTGYHNEKETTKQDRSSPRPSDDSTDLSSGCVWQARWTPEKITESSSPNSKQIYHPDKSICRDSEESCKASTLSPTAKGEKVAHSKAETSNSSNSLTVTLEGKDSRQTLGSCLETKQTGSKERLGGSLPSTSKESVSLDQKQTTGTKTTYSNQDNPVVDVQGYASTSSVPFSHTNSKVIKHVENFVPNQATQSNSSIDHGKQEPDIKAKRGNSVMIELESMDSAVADSEENQGGVGKKEEARCSELESQTTTTLSQEKQDSVEKCHLKTVVEREKSKSDVLLSQTALSPKFQGKNTGKCTSEKVELDVTMTEVLPSCEAPQQQIALFKKKHVAQIQDAGECRSEKKDLDTAVKQEESTYEAQTAPSQKKLEEEHEAGECTSDDEEELDATVLLPCSASEENEAQTHNSMETTTSFNSDSSLPRPSTPCGLCQEMTLDQFSVLDPDDLRCQSAMSIDVRLIPTTPSGKMGPPSRGATPCGKNTTRTPGKGQPTPPKTPAEKRQPGAFRQLFSSPPGGRYASTPAVERPKPPKFQLDLSVIDTAKEEPNRQCQDVPEASHKTAQAVRDILRDTDVVEKSEAEKSVPDKTHNEKKQQSETYREKKTSSYNSSGSVDKIVASSPKLAAPRRLPSKTEAFLKHLAAGNLKEDHEDAEEGNEGNKKFKPSKKHLSPERLKEDCEGYEEQKKENRQKIKSGRTPQKSLQKKTLDPSEFFPDLSSDEEDISDGPGEEFEEEILTSPTLGSKQAFSEKETSPSVQEELKVEKQSLHSKASHESQVLPVEETTQEKSVVMPSVIPATAKDSYLPTASLQQVSKNVPTSAGHQKDVAKRVIRSVQQTNLTSGKVLASTSMEDDSTCNTVVNTVKVLTSNIDTKTERKENIVDSNDVSSETCTMALHKQEGTPSTVVMSDISKTDVPIPRDVSHDQIIYFAHSTNVKELSDVLPSDSISLQVQNEAGTLTSQIQHSLCTTSKPHVGSDFQQPLQHSSHPRFAPHSHLPEHSVENIVMPTPQAAEVETPALQEPPPPITIADGIFPLQELPPPIPSADGIFRVPLPPVSRDLPPPTVAVPPPPLMYVAERPVIKLNKFSYAAICALETNYGYEWLWPVKPHAQDSVVVGEQQDSSVVPRENEPTQQSLGTKGNKPAVTPQLHPVVTEQQAWSGNEPSLNTEENKPAFTPHLGPVQNHQLLSSTQSLQSGDGGKSQSLNTVLSSGAIEKKDSRTDSNILQKMAGVRNVAPDSVLTIQSVVVEKSHSLSTVISSVSVGNQDSGTDGSMSQKTAGAQKIAPVVVLTKRRGKTVKDLLSESRKHKGNMKQQAGLVAGDGVKVADGGFKTQLQQGVPQVPAVQQVSGVPSVLQVKGVPLSQVPNMSQQPRVLQVTGVSQLLGLSQHPGVSQSLGVSQHPHVSQEPGVTKHPHVSQEPGVSQDKGVYRATGVSQLQDVQQVPCVSQLPGVPQVQGALQLQGVQQMHGVSHMPGMLQMTGGTKHAGVPQVSFVPGVVPSTVGRTGQISHPSDRNIFDALSRQTPIVSDVPRLTNHQESLKELHYPTQSVTMPTTCKERQDMPCRGPENRPRHKSTTNNKSSERLTSPNPDIWYKAFGSPKATGQHTDTFDMQRKEINKATVKSNTAGNKTAEENHQDTKDEDLSEGEIVSDEDDFKTVKPHEKFSHRGSLDKDGPYRNQASRRDGNISERCKDKERKGIRTGEDRNTYNSRSEKTAHMKGERTLKERSRHDLRRPASRVGNFVEQSCKVGEERRQRVERRGEQGRSRRVPWDRDSTSWEREQGSRKARRAERKGKR